MSEGTQAYDNLTAGQTYELKVGTGITCSTSDRLKLSYVKVMVGDQEVPEWVNFNQETGKLEITTPKTNQDVTYKFSIETKVEDQPEVYTKTFKLNVACCETADCSELKGTKLDI